MGALQTELQRLEHELSGSQTRLAEAGDVAALGVLTGLLAHEINNLLTPIGSYAQLALQRPDDDQLRRKALERAAAGAERGGRICEAILALARGTAGPQPVCEPEPTVASVGACWRSVIAGLGDLQTVDPIVRDERQGAGGSEAGAGAEHADLHVAMAPTALEQVLSNFVLNATRAISARASTTGSEADRIWLEVASAGPIIADPRFTWNTTTQALGDLAAGGVVLLVHDTGVGLSKDTLANLITAGDHSGSRAEGPGRGLGLAVCREMLRHAHGALGARSEPGQGSVFAAVLLPIT